MGVRHAVSLLTTATLVIGATLSLGTSASAAEDPAVEVAQMVADAVAAGAPAVAIVASAPTATGDLATAAGATSSPGTGAGTLRLVNGTADQAPGVADFPDVTLTLPAEAQVATATATVAPDGTVVYAGEGAVDVAVQATADGARVQTVLADASAPTKYTYTFGDGIVPVLNADGSVDLTVSLEEGVSMSVGHLDVPWAVDANGAPVATRYRVQGGAVVQSVEHRRGHAAYPVVADPNISKSCVWYGMCFIKFNRAYTNNIAAGTGLAVVASGLIALYAPLAPLAIVLAAKFGIDTVFANWVYNRNNCMAYQFPITNWLQPHTWAPYEVKRGSYNCA